MQRRLYEMLFCFCCFACDGLYFRVSFSLLVTYRKLTLYCEFLCNWISLIWEIFPMNFRFWSHWALNQFLSSQVASLKLVSEHRQSCHRYRWPIRKVTTKLTPISVIWLSYVQLWAVRRIVLKTSCRNSKLRWPRWLSTNNHQIQPIVSLVELFLYHNRWSHLHSDLMTILTRSGIRAPKLQGSISINKLSQLREKTQREFLCNYKFSRSYQQRRISLQFTIRHMQKWRRQNNISYKQCHIIAMFKII